MQLLIPKDEAIKILKERIQDLSDINLNTKIWEGKTILDIKQIFGPLSDQLLQISLYFETAITSLKGLKVPEERQAVIRLLYSYINFIEQKSKITTQRSQIKKPKFEEEYYTLLGEYNKQVEVQIALTKKQEILLEKLETLTIQLKESESEKQRIIENSLLIDKITLKKIWQCIINLPPQQIWVLSSILASLFLAGIFLGKLFERIGINNELFELKTENKELKFTNQKLQTQIDTFRLIPKAIKDNEIRQKQTGGVSINNTSRSLITIGDSNKINNK